jgi:hypothetical protein
MAVYSFTTLSDPMAAATLALGINDWPAHRNDPEHGTQEQIADIWPLRPADNQPNPCGSQFDTRRRGWPF